MNQPGLRIFSYLPNPRIYKATIVGRLCEVEVELRGATPPELADWLWDFDAVPLDAASKAEHAAAARQARTGFGGTLYKTDAFLSAHPYGTVPAGFSMDGVTGVFESNSIMRAVARQAQTNAGVYGHDAISASRIDSFLDVSLVFARDSQIYALALMGDRLTPAIHETTREALYHWLGGIETALANGDYLCGDTVTLADICFACEMALLANEHARRDRLAALDLPPLLGDALNAAMPRATAHFDALVKEPAFAPDLGPYLEKIHAAAARRGDAGAEEDPAQSAG